MDPGLALGAAALAVSALVAVTVSVTTIAGRRLGGLRRELAGARAGARATEEALAREIQRSRHLAHEVEILSAIREVSLIANDDVDLARILTEVLRVMEEVLETRSLAIYLREEAEERGLKARARREGGATRFDGDAPPPEAALVAEAWRLRRTLRRADAGEVLIATLLFADAEILGAIAVRAGARGAADEEVGALESGLEALAKHVALAIVKPTLYDKAVVDGLTRLFTKRHFSSQLARHIAACRRGRAALGLVLLDIDHFKKVNDTHGHPTGDLVLAAVAATVKETVREADTAYRVGGEEMAVIVPGAGLEEARGLAERIRRAVEGRAFRTDRGEPLAATVSAGVAAIGTKLADPASLFAAADAALYDAKRTGRNRVRAAGDPKAPVPPTPEPARESAPVKSARGAKKRTAKAPSRPRAKKKRAASVE
jgi:diguanylate cyclase (GGDEF)-like protein